MLGPDALSEGRDEAERWDQRLAAREIGDEVIDLEAGAEAREAAMLALREAFGALPMGESAVAADPLTAYLTRLRDFPVLDAYTQQDLAVRFREEQDVEAARILILTNLRLVVKIAREYRRQWTDLLELIQEGNVGLSEAILRYDPYRAVRFTSYAQYWIRAMILKHVRDNCHPMRIATSRASRTVYSRLARTRAQLVREGHASPSPALIAERLGVAEREVVEMTQCLEVAPLSLNEPPQVVVWQRDRRIDSRLDDVPLSELVCDDEASTPEELVDSDEVLRRVRHALVSFAETITDERDRALWTERLTSDSAKRAKLSELGERFGVTRERIRQLEVRLKEKARNFLRRQLGASLDHALGAEA